MMTRIIAVLLSLPLGFLPALTMADEEETLYNVVHLQAQAEREIPNNQMIVVLAAEHQGSDPADVSQQINRDMQWALEIIKRYTEVDSKSGNYQTHPLYNKQTISGWRASQQVELKSEKISDLTELTGTLQERLQVRQMRFTPTNSTRKQYENALIEDAMEAFRERVNLVGKHMTQKNHRIINLHINTDGSRPPILYERAAMKTMAMDSGQSPAVEAGVSKITVTVNGSVQFF